MEELNNVLVGELATIPFEKIDYIVLEHEYEFFKFTYVVVGVIKIKKTMGHVSINEHSDDIRISIARFSSDDYGLAKEYLSDLGKMFADWYNKSNKGKEEC